MSLEDIRSECSDTATLLQPYVDGELGGPEQERVAAHLESCRPCRAAVQEQHWVRATLRAVQREVAPAALRARVVAELDTLDQDAATSQAAVSAVSMSGMSSVTPSERRRARAPTGKRPSMWSRAMTTLADVARGGMVMVPASAVAVGLFFVAREGMVQVEPTGTNLGASLPSHAVHSRDDDGSADAGSATSALAGATPKSDLLVAPPRAPMQGDVQLVHARVGDHDASKGASLHYDVMRDGRPTGQRVVDHQIPVGNRPPSGIPVVFGGHRYLLDQTAIGDPVLHFEVGGVAHKVVLEGSVRLSPQRQPDLVDFSFLLDFADRNIKERAAEAP